MSSLINAIKSINIKQILTIFLASCVLLVSTACSQSPVAEANGAVDTAKRAMSDTYDDYDANQDFKGGMNGYNDDRRYNAKTAAKAKALVDSAKSRQKDSVSEYAEDIVDRAGNKIDRAANDIPQAAKNNADKAVRYVKDKSENLQENLSEVPEGAKKVFDGAVDTAQDAIEDANRASTRTVKEIKGNVKDLT